MRRDDLHEAEAELAKSLSTAQELITATMPQHQAGLIAICKELLQQTTGVSTTADEVPADGPATTGITAADAKVRFR